MSYTVLLASGSPRRKELLEILGIPFRVVTPSHTDETYPPGLDGGAIARYLAVHKSETYEGEVGDREILLTADTVVWHEGTELGKPSGREEAVAMLGRLSGVTHQVYTGVCLRTHSKKSEFAVCTDVTFGHLTPEEISYYVDRYEPYDKAGAYGIQEWIGHIGIRRIRGSYFNVMGLPVQKVYTEIKSLIG
jgi:septum formation protein